MIYKTKKPIKNILKFIKNDIGSYESMYKYVELREKIHTFNQKCIKTHTNLQEKFIHKHRHTHTKQK